MATLYQLHSTIDTLSRSTEELARTWRAGDSILLLGSTVAYIDWLKACLDENEVQGIAGIYALADDVAQLASSATAELNLNTQLTRLLTDDEWVEMTQDTDVHETNIDGAKFDKVVTIAL